LFLTAWAPGVQVIIKILVNALVRPGILPDLSQRTSEGPVNAPQPQRQTKRPIAGAGVYRNHIPLAVSLLPKNRDTKPVVGLGCRITAVMEVPGIT